MKRVSETAALVGPCGFGDKAFMGPFRHRRSEAGLDPVLPWLPLLFVLVALPVLAVLAVAVPPGEVPDEVAHIMRADSVRHGEIAGYRRPRVDEQGDPAVDVAVRADAGLLAAGFAFAPGVPLAAKHVTQTRLDELLALPGANRLEPILIPNTAVYPPLFYVPAAFGMEVAKLLHQGPFVAILAAHLVNAGCYVLLGAAAIHMARRGRVILFAILCLPMSLSLAASVNHDGLVIACAALSGALLTRLDRPAWWVGALLLGLAAMAKPYLLPLALIVPASAIGTGRGRAGQAAGGLAVAVLPPLAWAGMMAVFVAAPFVRGPAYPAGPLWAGPPGTMFATTNPGEQLRILLADPVRLISIPVDTLRQATEWLWRGALGVLGTLDVVLPTPLYSAWGWVLAAAVLAGFCAGRSERGGTLALPATAALVGAVASVWCVYLLQYLSWTHVGNALVEGVQGRYFLPVAALALPVAALPVIRGPAGNVLLATLSAPVVALAAAGLVIMPLVVLGAYYVR